jgi:hypothetical protein
MIHDSHNQSKLKSYNHLPRIRLANGDWYHVDEIGLVDGNRPTKASPKHEEIQQAANWFLMAAFCDAVQSAPTVSSYRLKHIISDWTHVYLSNGACILGAWSIGVRQIPERGGSRILNTRIAINQKWLSHHEGTLKAVRLLLAGRGER